MRGTSAPRRDGYTVAHRIAIFFLRVNARKDLTIIQRCIYDWIMNSAQQTTQHKIKAALLKTGLPVKEIEVYGSQIVITAWSVDAANNWASVVARFATLRGVIASMDYDEKNTNTVMLPSCHKVWRVFGRIN